MKFKPMFFFLSLILFLNLPSQIFAQRQPASNSGNYTIGLGPVGNFYVSSRRPEMSSGIGAQIYFDYRWSPELSTTATVMMLNQNGSGADKGENNIIFMGIPTFDIKYYFIRTPSQWEPFASIGVGYYVVTNGQKNRGWAHGLGAQVGGGVDYYINPRFSVGAASQFRSAALLRNGATGTFPVSLMGQAGFHF